MAYPATIPVAEHVLDDQQLRAQLVRVLRVAFPHDRWPDGPYERTADTLIEIAGADLHQQTALRAGLTSLDDAAHATFASLDEEHATLVLKDVQFTAWFRFVRANTVTTLYSSYDVYELLGYEGASFDQGGYLHRGFDDLRWLPEPRITAYEGPEQHTEQGPLPYEVRTSGSARSTASEDASKPAEWTPAMTTAEA